MADNKEMGRLLHDARKMVGRTQRSLAELLGIKHQQLSAWERGVERIPPSRIQELVKYLPHFEFQDSEAIQEIEAESQSLYFDDEKATKEFERLIASREGNITVLSGKELGILKPKIVEAAAQFLHGQENRMTFIFGAFGKDVIAWSQAAKASWLLPFERPTEDYELIHLRHAISRGDSDISERISFYCLKSPLENCNREENLQRHYLNRLLFPLTVMMVFEPKLEGTPRVGFLFSRNGFGLTERSQGAWFRLTSDFLGSVSSLLKAIITTNRASPLLQDLSRVIPSVS